MKTFPRVFRFRKSRINENGGNCIIMPEFSILHEWGGRGEGEAYWIWALITLRRVVIRLFFNFTVVKIILIHSTATYRPRCRSELGLCHVFPQATEYGYDFQTLQKLFIYSQCQRVEQYPQPGSQGPLSASRKVERGPWQRGRNIPGKVIDTGFFVYMLRNSCTWNTVSKSNPIHACIAQIKLKNY